MNNKNQNINTNQDPKKEQGNNSLLQKSIASVVVTIIVVCILNSLPFSSWNKPREESVAIKTNSTKKSTSTPESTPTIDPSIPLGISEMGVKRNRDGTWYFDGYFEKVSSTKYSSDLTVYIRAVNGKKFSTSVNIQRYAYINPYDGTRHIILPDLLDGNRTITQILFRFTFNPNGHLMNIEQVMQ